MGGGGGKVGWGEVKRGWFFFFCGGGGVVFQGLHCSTIFFLCCMLALNCDYMLSESETDLSWW